MVVATNVSYSKTQLTKIAMMANAGGAWTIRPYHTTGDGDELFAVSTEKLPADVPVSVTGALAAEVVQCMPVRFSRVPITTLHPASRTPVDVQRPSA